MSDSKNIEVMHRYIINIINDNQVRKEIYHSFVEKHKELCKKSKVLLNHIDFDSSLTSEETNVPVRDLKLKFMSKILIPEL